MQKFNVCLQDYPDVVVEIQRSYLTFTTKIFVNGVVAKKAGEQRRAYLIPLPDGLIKEIEVDKGGFDYYPRVYIDGKRIELARKLKWYEKILGGIPLLLIFGGGIGALCGAFATMNNYKILRSNKGILYKAIMMIGFTSMYISIYLGLGIIIGLLFNLGKK